MQQKCYKKGRLAPPFKRLFLTGRFPRRRKLPGPGYVDATGPVNGGIVEEVLLPLGKLDFGKGVLAKCDIALWRTRGEHLPLVGEFAFQVKFDRKEDMAEKQKKLVAQFYITLQREVAGWLALGVTKMLSALRAGRQIRRQQLETIPKIRIFGSAKEKTSVPSFLIGELDRSTYSIYSYCFTWPPSSSACALALVTEWR